MIKINLLPSKRKPVKKLSPLQQQLILGSLILAISTGIMVFWWWSLYSTINDLKVKKTDIDATIKKQEERLKEVKSVEEDEKKVNEKIDVIKTLEANQSGPVRILDEISKRLPKGVGLLSMTEKSGNISIEGMAFTNNDLVAFVDNLKRAPMFMNVTLLVTEQAKIEGTDLYKYKLELQLSKPKGT